LARLFSIHVTPEDGTPIYRQIIRQVSDAVASGSLAPGARLPSLRELAKRLVVAPLTVKRAYDSLEAQGLIQSRRGQGTFIHVDAVRSRRNAGARLRPLVRRLLLEAHLGRVDGAALTALIERERALLRRERKEHQEDAG
jgi:GntR family transcriptional regulator